MIRKLFEYALNYAPLLVLFDHYIDSPILFFIALTIGIFIMMTLPLFAIGLFVIIPVLWIWGLIIILNNYHLIWIITYCIFMLINVVSYFALFTSTIQKKPKSYKYKNERIVEIPYDLLKDDDAEIYIRYFTKEEIDRVVSFIPEKARYYANKPEDDGYIAVKLRELSFNERIELNDVVNEINASKKKKSLF